MLIRSVMVLCCLIGWSPVEPSTIKKNLSYSSHSHPIKPPTEASKHSLLLKPRVEDFPYFVENFFHRIIGPTGLDLHPHPSCSKIIQLEAAKPLEREILGNRWKLNLKESKNAPFLEMREKGGNEKGKTWKMWREFEEEKSWVQILDIKSHFLQRDLLNRKINRVGTRGLATSFLLASIFSSPQRNTERLASKMSPSTESEGSSQLSVTEVLDGGVRWVAQKVLGTCKGILWLIQWQGNFLVNGNRQCAGRTSLRKHCPSPQNADGTPFIPHCSNHIVDIPKAGSLHSLSEIPWQWLFRISWVCSRRLIKADKKKILCPCKDVCNVNFYSNSSMISVDIHVHFRGA